MPNELPIQLRRILERPATDRWIHALQEVASAYGAVTATLHQAEPDSTLSMLASLGIPEHLLPVTQRIPFGKGMAGLCAERREPITVCNLQTDDSGVVRPSAKQTGVAGAVTIPILASDRLLGTLGIGKPGAHDYTEAEILNLQHCAAEFARAMSE
jgi:L-methionine (R)-S-oxide reductase